MTEQAPKKVQPASNGSTFAERAQARAEAEKNGEQPVQRQRRSLRAGRDAEGMDGMTVTYVQD